jgi:diguanylate cyclase (GGDEF)-like protein
MDFHWSTHQLTEYFAAVSASSDEEATVRTAVERAVEALDAEIGAVVVDGEELPRGLVGLPGLEASALRAAVDGSPQIALPGVGVAFAAHAALGSAVGGGLIVARLDEGLGAEERQMLQGMAQVLGLALRNLRMLAVERSLREEGEREAARRLELLEVVRARQALLETLLAIQRAISQREPLQSVLDAVTAGASELLGDAAIALVLADPTEPSSLIVASTSRWSASPSMTSTALVAAAESMSAAGAPVRPLREDHVGRLRAAPVHVSGAIAGSLVAELSEQAGSEKDLTELLSAFAQQISIALTDARTVEAVREAYRDTLTGLPNRKLFLERLEQALGQAGARQLVVLFIDLDRFKSVNDSLGHRAGDDLLGQVSDRIRTCLRASDVAARLGGDEFAVLLEHASIQDAQRLAERIAAVVAEPFCVADRTVYIGSSIGIAACDQSVTDAAELLGNADVAMYRAKKARSSQVVLFEPSMHAEVVTRLEFQVDLTHALAGGQFRLVYQPLIALDTGGLHGMEALLRWQHPDRGAVPPDVLIAAAEELGLINDIGGWVLNEGLHQLAQWRRSVPGLTISINASPREIADQQYVRRVIAALDAAAVPGDALTIELTETALMTDPATALRHLRLLKDAGVGLAVDDFGTGYSSLSYLRQFPVDQVKIDRTFVAGVSRSTEDRAVVKAIIQLGRALHLEVVAEGIEDGAQLRALRRLGCHLGQGYHLYRPLEREACTDVVRGASASAAAGPSTRAG